jgi:hypothetical protein
MARERRSIAGSAYESDKLDLCNDSEMCLFFGLIVKADDEGRETAGPVNLKKRFANRDWSTKKIEKMMQKLHEVELIRWYFCECGKFYEVIDFEYYQRGSWQSVHRVISKYQSSDDGHCKRCHGPLLPVVQVTISSPNRSEMKRNEEKVKEKQKDAHTCEGEPETPALERFARAVAGANGIDPSLRSQAQDETAQDRRRGA